MGGQFYRKGKLPLDVANATLGDVASFDLAWTFMGHSYTYILFIGISQLIGVWFLLWEKTKLLGVGVLIPIMVNIIVFDIIFLDAYGALASAIIYFGMLMAILFFNRERIIEIFILLTLSTGKGKFTFSLSIKSIATILIIMALAFAIDQSLVNLLGHGKG